jgi:hypothetical protein
MRTDGSNVIKISNDNCDELEVVGDTIYFAEHSERKLYKMNTDGTNKVKLADNVNGMFNISNNWIYYIRRSNDNQELYKIRTNGTDITKISVINDIQRINTVGNYIYFDRYYSDGFFKVNINGSGLTQLSKSNLYGWNVTGDWIYYTIPVGYNSINANKLYKMKTDGTNIIQLTDYGIGNFNVANDWIYFAKISDPDHYCRLRVDGTSLQVISELKITTAESFR